MYDSHLQTCTIHFQAQTICFIYGFDNFQLSFVNLYFIIISLYFIKFSRVSIVVYNHIIKFYFHLRHTFSDFYNVYLVPSTIRAMLFCGSTPPEERSWNSVIGRLDCLFSPKTILIFLSNYCWIFFVRCLLVHGLYLYTSVYNTIKYVSNDHYLLTYAAERISVLDFIKSVFLFSDSLGSLMIDRILSTVCENMDESLWTSGNRWPDLYPSPNLHVGFQQWTVTLTGTLSLILGLRPFLSQLWRRFICVFRYIT